MDDSYHYSENRQKANPENLQLGFDRGFMCMKQHALRLGEDAYWNSHTLLNACPQKSKLSRGIWLDLGRMIADWADDFGPLWVITGPVIYNNKPLIWLGQDGEVPVAIPNAFFKIVVRIRDGRPQVLAFIYPQEGIAYKRTGGYDHTPYLTSVDTIEALTGLNFFPDVPENVERELRLAQQMQIGVTDRMVNAANMFKTDFRMDAVGRFSYNDDLKGRFEAAMQEFERQVSMLYRGIRPK